MARLYTSFAEFWPYYLREHSRPRTRMLHYIGTTLVVALAIAALLSGRWLLLLALPLAGYFFAWIAHFTVEKNAPPPSPIRCGAWRRISRCGGCG
jgi:hypothetical protein